MGGGEEDPLCLSKPILSELESVLRVTANTGPTLGGDTQEPREVGSGGRDYLVICSGTWGAASPGWHCCRQRGGASARPWRGGPFSFSQPPFLSLFPSLNLRFIQAAPSPSALHKEEPRGRGRGFWWLLNPRLNFPLSPMCVNDRMGV